MMTRLYLVRHGESVWNAEQRLQGQADPPLSARGEAQAAALGDVLGRRSVAAVYVSPLVRARATAEAVAAPLHQQPRLVEALRELDLGAWQGHTVVDLGAAEHGVYRAWIADPTAVRPPGGESLSEALSRVAPAFDAIVAAHRGATVVVVTHSIVGRVALCYLLGIGLRLVPRFKLKTASVSKLHIDAGGAVLSCLGDVSHLRTVKEDRPSACSTPRVESAR